MKYHAVIKHRNDIIVFDILIITHYTIYRRKLMILMKASKKLKMEMLTAFC